MLGAYAISIYLLRFVRHTQQNPYFKEISRTYLHLMPLFRSTGESDGGYAAAVIEEQPSLRHATALCPGGELRRVSAQADWLKPGI
jgi:hypothetical protein